MDHNNDFDKYENIDLYEYKKIRKKERIKSTFVNTEDSNRARDEVWNLLLTKSESTSNNVFQRMSYHTFMPKPNMEDAVANEASILLYESQRRFLQSVDHSIREGQNVMHLDLSSAYLTALATIKHSLKFNTKYPLEFLNEVNDIKNVPRHYYVLEDKFNIIKIRLKMPYDSRLNIFTPNNKIRYKDKEISDTNLPDYGEEVAVRLELFVNKEYNIDSWMSFTQIFKDYEIDYQRIEVFTYDLIDRKQTFDLEQVKELLEKLKSMNKYEKGNYKKAMVSFTGQLMNVDPGKRLLMLLSCEEVMRRVYIDLSSKTKVYGLQIDGVYFEPYNWTKDNSPSKIAYRIGTHVYRIDPNNYSEQLESRRLDDE